MPCPGFHAAVQASGSGAVWFSCWGGMSPCWKHLRVALLSLVSWLLMRGPLSTIADKSQLSRQCDRRSPSGMVTDYLQKVKMTLRNAPILQQGCSPNRTMSVVEFCFGSRFEWLLSVPLRASQHAESCGLFGSSAGSEMQAVQLSGCCKHSTCLWSF